MLAHSLLQSFDRVASNAGDAWQRQLSPGKARCFNQVGRLASPFQRHCSRTAIELLALCLPGKEDLVPTVEPFHGSLWRLSLVASLCAGLSWNSPKHTYTFIHIHPPCGTQAKSGSPYALPKGKQQPVSHILLDLTLPERGCRGLAPLNGKRSSSLNIASKCEIYLIPISRNTCTPVCERQLLHMQ